MTLEIDDTYDVLLELRNVSYGYGEDRLALDNVSVQFRKGERVAVLGENGAGKSTFFLCCIGVLKPERGEIFLDGSPVEWNKRGLVNLRSSVGLVFQDPDDQIVSATVESEIAFGPLNMGLDDGEIRLRVHEAGEALGLKHLMKRPPHFLSGGEKKRVTIADVLSMRPRLVLLDEPTASLDPRGSQQLHEILDQLNESGMTIVLSTHDVDFAYSWADRILVFTRGKLVADDSAISVLSRRSLLEECGLRTPILMQVAEVLRSELASNSEPSLSELPRNMDELSEYLVSLRKR